MTRKFLFYCLFSLFTAWACSDSKGQPIPAPITIAGGWKLQEAPQVHATGKVISGSAFSTAGWYPAAVPGTVLTTLVNNRVYPEPLYGENNRPDKIPESLSRQDYWYRTSFTIPKSYQGKKIWLNFEGINYSADVWVNGKHIGKVKGAFSRGIFDISSVAVPGKTAVLGVFISPQPNPGISHEHTIKDGMGANGGLSAIDGPTFLCSMGWDWIPAIRDRNTGIWKEVFLSASGPVRIQNPLVTTDVSLPDLKTADLHIEATVENSTDRPQQGIIEGTFGNNVRFQKAVTLAPKSSQLVSFNAAEHKQLHVVNPRLWWPNGYGPQNLYDLKLSFISGGVTSDVRKITFGIRKITYTVPDAENLTLSFNGVRIFCKGGNWGMDEAMKRIPKERLEAQIRMHQIANYTMIRNWVGQSTNEDFYDLCDKYGILLWDEFFQPNPSDGPNPTDLDLYIANVREKILRFRNHPSIALWCARNEGYPPKNIDDALQKLMSELEPVRLYQPSSTAGRGVNSGGPYFWRKPADYYTFNEAFKTEIGSVSIPTLQSIHGMMPEKDWEVMNDDWAEHDLANGAQKGIDYHKMIGERYGKVINLADFVRKAQLANYEAYRAMYEGRNAKLFKPSTGVLTWMSNPAQPSFVWQLYHHDLEPNAALFAARKGCEPVHVQLNEKERTVQIVNNLPSPIPGASVLLKVYNSSSALIYTHQFRADTALPAATTTLEPVQWPEKLSPVYFVKLELKDQSGKLLSENFYWQADPAHAGDLTGLDQLPAAKLDATIKRADNNEKCLLYITLRNPGNTIALMAHLQLCKNTSKDRVLPVYYSDNYISLLPGESKTITIEAAKSDLGKERPLVLLDGWNTGVTPVSNAGAGIALNTASQVAAWPETGLPLYSR